MKKYLLLLAGLVFITHMYGGIYRHDVPAGKYKKLAEGKQFDCVGMVLTNCGENFYGGCTFRGSCVLIGNKYVLSAAHCLTKAEIKLDTYYLDQNRKRTDSLIKGGSMLIVNQPTVTRSDTTANFSFRFKDRLYYPKKWQIYQPYLDSVNATPSAEFCGDLVLIELNDTVAGVQPATLNEAFDEKGTTVTGVGYGMSGPADRPDELGEYCEKIAGQNVVDNIDGYKVNGKATLLSCDFDSPNGYDHNRMGSAKPLPLEWSPMPGDSGGGLFRNVHGHWQLIGIVTGGPNTGADIQQVRTNCYGRIASYARTSVFNDWIRETIKSFSRKMVRDQ